MSRELTNAQHDEYMNTFIRSAHRGRFAAPQGPPQGGQVAPTNGIDVCGRRNWSAPGAGGLTRTR